MLREKGIFPTEYLLANTMFPITEANTGSLIEVSVNESFSTGIPINTGSLSISFAISMSPFAFDPPPTSIAHSGSIPSLPTLLSSSLTK